MKTSENKTLECIYLPSTQRQDGSFRKPIKIKPGFIPKEEIPKYTIPIKKANNLQKVLSHLQMS